MTVTSLIPEFLRIASDLHNEWSRKDVVAEEILPSDPRDASSFLVLAGDIGQGRPLKKFLEDICPRFIRVIYVPGNHEYYGGPGYDKSNENLIKLLSHISNLDIAAGKTLSCTWGNFTYIFTTMWTDCDNGNPLSVQAIQEGMNDFRAIPDFTAVKSIRLFEKAEREIERALRSAEKVGTKSIVITHHMPSHRLIQERWKRPGYSEINGGFAANCDDFFGQTWSPEVWIFGHTHDKIDQVIESTRCIANPKGYPGESACFNQFEFLKLTRN